MPDTLKIKLTIADRVYPLTIDATQEEGLRKAAKNIESLIKQFEQNYAVRDKQDVLAMCALQFASKLEQRSIDKENTTAQIEARLNVLNQRLQQQLSS